MATGGQENDLKLFDITKKEPLFHAKNLANDWLSLRQPVWIRDIGFIHKSEEINNLPKMAVVTDSGFLRIYDPKVQRRPVVNVPLVDHPLISMAVFPENTSPGPLPFIVAGSAQGWLSIVDLRQPKAAQGKPLPGNCIVKHRLEGRCRGIAGSTRSVEVLPRSNGKPLIVAGGLDRFVRVFDSALPKSGAMSKVYVKSKLNCLAVNPDVNADAMYEIISKIDHDIKPKRPKIEEDELPALVDGSDGDYDDDEDFSGSDEGDDDDEGDEDEDNDDDDDDDGDDDDSVEYCGSVDLDNFDDKPKRKRR